LTRLDWLTFIETCFMGLSPNLSKKIGRQNIPKGKELFPMGGETKVMAYHAKKTT